MERVRSYLKSALSTFAMATHQASLIEHGQVLDHGLSRNGQSVGQRGGGSVAQTRKSFE
jgi:hypothetical protein